MEVPVTNTPEASLGKPKTCANQRVIWRSTSMPMWLRPPQLALRPAASISASMPTGVPAPCTQPMNRGWVLPVA